jgi:phosphoglycolate phosphatase
MSWPRAILFDLDVTLIDSAPELLTIAETMLARNGLGPLELKAVRDMIGNGIRKLVERGFTACAPFAISLISETLARTLERDGF